MQKRTLYLSLLLVSCLLFFGFSYASAQSVTFQSKTVPRCTETVLNVTVNSQEDLSAYELVFDITGDYSSFDVDFEDVGCLTNQIGPIIDGNVVLMAATMAESGDCCLDASGGVVVATITVVTADVCDGAVTIAGTTTTPCDVEVSTNLVGCPPAPLASSTVPGTVTIVNQLPWITCPGDTTIHWGDYLEMDALFGDDDTCEVLSLNVIGGPGAIDNNGHYTWQTGGDDVCDHVCSLEVVDKCNAADTCYFNICVQNTPPVVAEDSISILAAYGITVSDTVEATDPDGGPNSLLYTVVDFDGPTWFGTGFNLDANTGIWTWDIGPDPAYLCDFTLLIKVSDGANICDPCSPQNADTVWYSIHVTGFGVLIEKVHQQHLGEMTTVSIWLDSGFTETCDPIGGFDFLITYDASALTGMGAEAGELIDTEFEYFTFRNGPFGNCGNGCPTGQIRLVGLRETNDGIVNPAPPVTGPGELAKLKFLVVNDYNFSGQFVPIRFFWIDCGDNTLSDETGNWLYLGMEGMVFDFLGNPVTDSIKYGFSGPDTSCYKTVYIGHVELQKAPLGAIIFRNGGVDIIPVEEVDDRGDINLNGVKHEIADAVVFTNYFIKGLAAFTINEYGQSLATDVNADGIGLTVADLVYLIRVIVGDASPYPPKENPNAFATFSARGEIVGVEANADIGAALFVFDGHVTPSLAQDASHMELVYGYDGKMTRALVYSMEEGRAITSGEVLNLHGEATLVSVEAAEYRGATLKTITEVLPTDFALRQNYPNPFNPVTTLSLELPVATNWTISIFNVQGQRVAEFNGYNEAGIVSVNWDAGNMASGLYFYKAEAGAFSATKKMVLLK